MERGSKEMTGYNVFGQLDTGPGADQSAGPVHGQAN